MITINNRGISTKNSLLWQIRLPDCDNIAIVAGTMHIAFPGYEAIVNRFLAVMQSNNVKHYFGETDMNDMSAHAGSLTSDFKRLSDQMSPQRFQNYRKKLLHFTSLDLRHYDLLPPMLLSSLIASKLISYDQASIDEILWKEAEQQGCSLQGLESFEEQMQIFHQIPYDYQLRQAKKVMGNLSKCRVSLSNLIELFRRQAIHQLYVQGKRTLGPIKSLMLNERNDRMVVRMVRHLKESSGPCFFSFGAAHLAGKYGILHGLKNQGCSIAPIA